MLRTDLKIDGYENDPGRWGASLANNAEFLLGALDVAAPGSVMEVGAYAGDLTRLLLDWALPHGARIVAVDPDPKPPLVALEAAEPRLDLVRATSHDALDRIELTDAIILDGDHNYFTVLGELERIDRRSKDAGLPLLLFHDVGWPHGRRDLYESIEDIPEAERHRAVEGGGLFPGVEGIRPGGLPMRHSAEREGGPRNGVLTAIEDFMSGREGELRLARVPSFFGFGALWRRDAPYADALAELLDPWDANPILERLEANRVLHLASSHVHMVEAGRWQQRDAAKAALLEKLLISKSFALAQRISRLRQRGEPAFSKQEIRELLRPPR